MRESSLEGLVRLQLFGVVGFLDFRELVLYLLRGFGCTEFVGL